MVRGSTKDRVIEAAVRLFNGRGTAAVSTNHIAQEAGISPGNLYYHFRNKEEIIREIFGRIDAHWEESYVLPPDRSPALEDVVAMVEETYAGLWEFRFFYRELGALTRRDPELARRYRMLRERALGGTEALLRGFAAAGMLEEPEDPAAVPELAKTLVLVAEGWLPFEEAGGEDLDPQKVREGATLMMRILEPRMKAEAPVGTSGEEGRTRR